MVSVLTKSREKQFLENGKSGHWNLEKSMKIKKILLSYILLNILKRTPYHVPTYIVVVRTCMYIKKTLNPEIANLYK